MTDSRLRELERKAATGDVDAEVRLLVDRHRLLEPSLVRCECCQGGRKSPSATVGAERRCAACSGTGRTTLVYGMTLAAYLGHEASRLALSVVDRHGFWHGSSFDRHFPNWVCGLSGFGREAVVRAGVAGARLVLPAWEEKHRLLELYPLHGRFFAAARETVEATERWVADQCEENARTANDAQLRFGLGAALREVAWCTYPALAASGSSTVQCIEYGTRAVLEFLGNGSEARDAVRRAVRDEVVPAALGTRDPVRDRLAA